MISAVNNISMKQNYNKKNTSFKANAEVVDFALKKGQILKEKERLKNLGVTIFNGFFQQFPVRGQGITDIRKVIAQKLIEKTERDFAKVSNEGFSIPQDSLGVSSDSFLPKREASSAESLRDRVNNSTGKMEKIIEKATFIKKMEDYSKRTRAFIAHTEQTIEEIKKL